MKIKVYHPNPDSEMHVFWCAACKETHTFEVGEDKWDFNGDMEFPSYSPSLRYPDCHLILWRGTIYYCKDCNHEMKGQRVPLEPY